MFQGSFLQKTKDTARKQLEVGKTNQQEKLARNLGMYAKKS